MKVRSDHRSEFSNLCNWKLEARIRTRHLRVTGAMLYRLSYEAKDCVFQADLVSIMESELYALWIIPGLA